MWIIEHVDDAWGDDERNIVCLPASKYSEKQIKDRIKKANQNVKDEVDPRLVYDKVPIGTLDDIW